LSGNG
jgi:hypothetical protein